MLTAFEKFADDPISFMDHVIVALLLLDLFLAAFVVI